MGLRLYQRYCIITECQQVSIANNIKNVNGPHQSKSVSYGSLPELLSFIKCSVDIERHCKSNLPLKSSKRDCLVKL